MDFISIYREQMPSLIKIYGVTEFIKVNYEYHFSGGTFTEST